MQANIASSAVMDSEFILARSSHEGDKSNEAFSIDALHLYKEELPCTNNQTVTVDNPLAQPID